MQTNAPARCNTALQDDPGAAQGLDEPREGREEVQPRLRLHFRRRGAQVREGFAQGRPDRGDRDGIARFAGGSTRTRSSKAVRSRSMPAVTPVPRQEIDATTPESPRRVRH